MLYVNEWTDSPTVALSPLGVPSPGTPLPINAAALVERCLGNLRLAREFIRLFTVAYPECIEQLLTALSSNDMLATRSAARRLRDTAAKVNAEEIASIADEIELAAGSGDISAAHVRVAALTDAWRNFEQNARLD